MGPGSPSRGGASCIGLRVLAIQPADFTAVDEAAVHQKVPQAYLSVQGAALAWLLLIRIDSEEKMAENGAFSKAKSAIFRSLEPRPLNTSH